MLQEAKKKTGKLTDHGKQLLPRAMISNVTRGELWEMIGRGEPRGGGGGGGGDEEDVNSIIIKHMFFDLMQLVRIVFY